MGLQKMLHLLGADRDNRNCLKIDARVTADLGDRQNAKQVPLLDMEHRADTTSEAIRYTSAVQNHVKKSGVTEVAPRSCKAGTTTGER